MLLFPAINIVSKSGFMQLPVVRDRAANLTELSYFSLTAEKLRHARSLIM